MRLAVLLSQAARPLRSLQEYHATRVTGVRHHPSVLRSASHSQVARWLWQWRWLAPSRRSSKPRGLSLEGCGKTIVARWKFNGPHVWGHGRNTLQDAQKVRPARPQRVKDRGVPSGYVEGLNDARMLHGKGRVLARLGWAGEKSDFFSFLQVKDTDCGWFIVSFAVISNAATGDRRSR